MSALCVLLIMSALSALLLTTTAANAFTPSSSVAYNRPNGAATKRTTDRSSSSYGCNAEIRSYYRRMMDHSFQQSYKNSQSLLLLLDSSRDNNNDNVDDMKKLKETTTAIVVENDDQTQQQARISSSSENNANNQKPGNVYTVDTLRDFDNIVTIDHDESQRFVVVWFHTPWCKSCQAVTTLFYRLARSKPEVIFVEISLTKYNADIPQRLDIPSVPFGHIYHPRHGLVEEMSIPKKAFRDFETILQSHMDGECDVADADDYSCPYVEVI